MSSKAKSPADGTKTKWQKVVFPPFLGEGWFPGWELAPGNCGKKWCPENECVFVRDESHRKRVQRVLSKDYGTRWGREGRWGLPQKTKHWGDRSSTAPLNETSRSHEVRVGAPSKEFPFHTRIFGTRAKLNHQRNLRPDAERDISAGILPPPPPPSLSPAAPTCYAVLRPLQPSGSPCRFAPESSRGPELSLAHPESPPSPACLPSQRPLSATERTRGWRRQVVAASWQGRCKV